MGKLKKVLTEFDDTLKKEEVEIPGELGAYIKGKKTVEVPNRPHYVYVRLRTNLSEIIQAYNDSVSPSFRLPVLVKREGNKYIVIGLESNRYSNWENTNRYIPRHGDTHSFDLEGNKMGADPVWVYPQQFMPSLVAPFGVHGAENAFVYAHSFINNGTWHYSGNTGTPSLTNYNPTTGLRLVLITMDTITGNPTLFASTGTSIATTITGTAALLPYLPVFDESRYLPLSFAALQSGTFSVGWDNLHDVRPLAGGGLATSMDWLNIQNAPTEILENLSSQITGTGTHFTLTHTATEKIRVWCGVLQPISSYYMDDNYAGFTLGYAPTLFDSLLVGYKYL